MIPIAQGVAHIIAETSPRQAESSPTGREQGAAVRRIQPGNGLKSAVSRASESARRKDGKRAAEAEGHRLTRVLGLPMDNQNRVLYPDAQIAYEDPDGCTGRVSIGAVSGNYREPAVRAKGAAGFATHPPRPGYSAGSAWATRMAPGSGDLPPATQPQPNSDQKEHHDAPSEAQRGTHRLPQDGPASERTGPTRHMPPPSAVSEAMVDGRSTGTSCRLWETGTGVTDPAKEEAMTKEKTGPEHAGAETGGPPENRSATDRGTSARHVADRMVSKKSEAIIKEVSVRRRKAMKILADR